MLGARNSVPEKKRVFENEVEDGNFRDEEVNNRAHLKSTGVAGPGNQ